MSLLEKIVEREQSARGRLLAKYRDILLRDLAGEPASGDAKELPKLLRDLGKSAADAKADQEALAAAADLRDQAAAVEAAQSALAEAARVEREHHEAVEERERADRKKTGDLFVETARATGRLKRAKSARAQLAKLQRQRPELFAGQAEGDGDAEGE